MEKILERKKEKNQTQNAQNLFPKACSENGDKAAIKSSA